MGTFTGAWIYFFGGHNSSHYGILLLQKNIYSIIIIIFEFKNSWKIAFSLVI